jgi:hypothetical protein
VKRQRVSLEKWAGTTIASKELAKKLLSRMETAVFDGSFDKAGERAHLRRWSNTQVSDVDR